MPTLPAKAKKLKDLACVLRVLFSVIIARIVLLNTPVSQINHSSVERDLHNCSGEDPRQTSEENHLPYRLAESEECCSNRYSDQRQYQHRLSPKPIRRATP